ncbi:MAG: diguanylate phosphodiesterase, partial [Verrucomicrobiales bacterium]|nr:diguanylate phosphodiesterase [Verrucomicrobiales bacterium]
AVVAVLDVDSDTPAAFSPEDLAFLEKVCKMLGRRFHN